MTKKKIAVAVNAFINVSGGCSLIVTSRDNEFLALTEAFPRTAYHFDLADVFSGSSYRPHEAEEFWRDWNEKES